MPKKKKPRVKQVPTHGTAVDKAKKSRYDQPTFSPDWDAPDAPSLKDPGVNIRSLTWEQREKTRKAMEDKYGVKFK